MDATWDGVMDACSVVNSVVMRASLTAVHSAVCSVDCLADLMDAWLVVEKVA